MPVRYTAPKGTGRRAATAGGPNQTRIEIMMGKIAVATLATTLALASHPGAVQAADAAHPYSNVNHANDAGNDTGDSQTDQLNEQQLQKVAPGANAGGGQQEYGQRADGQRSYRQQSYGQAGYANAAPERAPPPGYRPYPPPYGYAYPPYAYPYPPVYVVT
jgi:hypothetical protein